MSSLLCVLRIVFLSLVAFYPVTAFAEDWKVSRTTKQVSYTIDKKTWEAVEVGTVIPSKAWMSTGPRGRVTLTRGEESLSLSPNTLGAVITTEGLFSRKTEVVQQKGEIALNIEKRSRPHTYVHTPFLAAVVKGTTFTVTVTEQAASVSVDEGLVEVSSFTGGQSADVGPGQQVTVDQAQNMSVAGIAEPPSVVSVEPMQASVPAVGQPAPVGAGLGLDTFGDQSSASASDDGGSNGVSGESSEGGDSFGQQTVAGNNGVGNGEGSSAGHGGNGVGNNGNGNNGAAGDSRDGSDGKGRAGNNSNAGGNGNSGHGHGNSNGGGNGNGVGKGNETTGDGKGNNGNGKGNGGGNGKGNNGNGNGNGGNHGRD
tara:strand:- start:332 stop:1438 length:1107 start_codon:yes stop_codon:yes gene_type:complete